MLNEKTVVIPTGNTCRQLIVVVGALGTNDCGANFLLLVLRVIHAGQQILFLSKLTSSDSNHTDTVPNLQQRIWTNESMQDYTPSLHCNIAFKRQAHFRKFLRFRRSQSTVVWYLSCKIFYPCITQLCSSCCIYVRGRDNIRRLRPRCVPTMPKLV